MPASPPAALQSVAALRNAFTAGLGELLREPQLEPLILVLANASFDPQIREQLEPALTRAFDSVRDAWVTSLGRGQDLPAVEEDLAVFLRLALIGHSALATTENRQAGPWALQFNLLRAFRPRRISQQSFSGLHAPFNPAAFNFNRPFLQREALWADTLCGRDCHWYYNKYPFAPLHGLLVPERRAEHPQYLSGPLLTWTWAVLESLGPALPGLGLGYNSLGGNASVNHLHLQFFIDPGLLPIESPAWSHNGGTNPYPLRCETFSELAELQARVTDLHRLGQPYNLFCRPGRIYLCPRRPQDSVTPPDWSSGLTWLEIAGSFVCANRHQYLDLDARTLTALLEVFRPAVGHVGD